MGIPSRDQDEPFLTKMSQNEPKWAKMSQKFVPAKRSPRDSGALTRTSSIHGGPPPRSRCLYRHVVTGAPHPALECPGPNLGPGHVLSAAIAALRTPPGESLGGVGPRVSLYIRWDAAIHVVRGGIPAVPPYAGLFGRLWPVLGPSLAQFGLLWPVFGPSWPVLAH